MTRCLLAELSHQGFHRDTYGVQRYVESLHERRTELAVVRDLERRIVPGSPFLRNSHEGGADGSTSGFRRRGRKNSRQPNFGRKAKTLDSWEVSSGEFFRTSPHSFLRPSHRSWAVSEPWDLPAVHLWARTVLLKGRGLTGGAEGPLAGTRASREPISLLTRARRRFSGPVPGRNMWGRRAHDDGQFA